MKVLTVHNIANVPGSINNGLKRLGVDAMVEDYYDLYFDFPADKCLHLQNYTAVGKLWQRFKNYVWALRSFDVVHMHSAALLPFYLDGLLYPFVPGAKAKLVYSHWGADMRYSKRIPLLSRVRCAYRTVCPDLSDFAPGVDVIPVTIEPDDWLPAKRTKRALKSNGKLVRLLHAPTNREFKNSNVIFAAVEELKRRGVKFKFTLVEGVKLTELKRILSECDIVVEAMNGWYYTFGAEALSMNKVVVDQLNPAWKAKFAPDAPIVDATPHTLADELQKLIEHRAYRERIASKGRAFVLRRHSADVVARKLKREYERILRAP